MTLEVPSSTVGFKYSFAPLTLTTVHSNIPSNFEIISSISRTVRSAHKSIPSYVLLASIISETSQCSLSNKKTHSVSEFVAASRTSNRGSPSLHLLKRSFMASFIDLRCSMLPPVLASLVDSLWALYPQRSSCVLTQAMQADQQMDFCHFDAVCGFNQGSEQGQVQRID